MSRTRCARRTPLRSATATRRNSIKPPPSAFSGCSPMPVTPLSSHDGLPSGRREDHRLVTGAGEYADDRNFPGMAHAVMVRSPHAHARIKKIDCSQALARPGILAVLTGADALADGLNPIPHATGSSQAGSDVGLAHRDGSERLINRQWPLPLERARFAGEAVAMVVAETPTAAQDGAEAVEIDWEPLPALVDSLDALEEGAPLLWEHIPGNRTLEAHLGDEAATAAAFAHAAH